MDGDQPHDHAGDLPAEVTSQVPRRRRRAPWRPPTARRLARGVAIGLAVLVPAAAWGVTTAQTQASLGPHLAHYEVTVDHLVTIDLGPLGTVVIASVRLSCNHRSRIPSVTKQRRVSRAMWSSNRT